MASNNQMKLIGSIWNKVSREKGTKYISGSIKVNGEEVRFVGFANKKKTKGDTLADVYLYLSENKVTSSPKQAPTQIVKPQPQDEDEGLI